MEPISNIRYDKASLNNYLSKDLDAAAREIINTIFDECNKADEQGIKDDVLTGSERVDFFNKIEKKLKDMFENAKKLKEEKNIPDKDINLDNLKGRLTQIYQSVVDFQTVVEVTEELSNEFKIQQKQEQESKIKGSWGLSKD